MSNLLWRIRTEYSLLRRRWARHVHSKATKAGQRQAAHDRFLNDPLIRARVIRMGGAA